jgi:hypothetical protein
MAQIGPWIFSHAMGWRVQYTVGGENTKLPTWTRIVNEER